MNPAPVFGALEKMSWLWSMERQEDGSHRDDVEGLAAVQEFSFRRVEKAD
jgi:hypothetical protein